MPPEKSAEQKGNFKDEDAVGLHRTEHHSCCSGASCSFVQSAGRVYAEIKAVVQVHHSFFVLQTEKERFGYDSESCSDHGLGQ